MTAAREASAQELELLWSAVSDGDYAEDVSDGYLQWAFLIDFRCQGASAIFPGLSGAIVYAENEVGPTAAWLYMGRLELAGAWRDTFSDRLAAGAGHCRGGDR